MRKALIVGINNYPSYPLDGCINDAVKMKEVLERNEDGTLNFEVVPLISSDKKITKSILKKEIDRLFFGEADVEIALLYFAGHGYINTYGGHLVTPDYKEFDEGVSMDDILCIANRSKARNRIIILDCCHSGNIGNSSIHNSKISELADGITILTSCRSSEVSDENKSNGIFSSLIIDALSGACSDLLGNITTGSIYAYIDQALGAWERQRPVFKTNVSTFTSLRKVTPPMEMSLLRKIPEYFIEPNHEYHLNPTFEFTASDHIDSNVEAFKNLQKMAGIGLVKPVGEEHMYFAAINSGSCKLTTLGTRYWHLAKESRF